MFSAFDSKSDCFLIALVRYTSWNKTRDMYFCNIWIMILQL